MADRSVRTVEALGAAIRKRRRKMGWDQQELAQRVRVSRQWIVEIEAGKPRAEIGLLLNTLQALDLRMEIVPEDALPKGALDLIKVYRSGRHSDGDPDFFDLDIEAETGPTRHRRK